MDDRAIVHLYQNRDEKAIEASSEKYGRGLLAISNRILLELETAKECENDTYLEAWNLIPPHDPSSYLFAFFARIIRHISLDVYRKNHAQKRNANLMELTEEMEQCLSGGSANLEDTMIVQELGRAISEFLRKLPKDQRQIFVRRYWYMNSVEELCQIFGFSESKVKSMLFRIRGKLKLYLEKEGYDV